MARTSATPILLDAVLGTALSAWPGPCRVTHIRAVNLGAAVAWLHLYDKDPADVTVGTTARKQSLFVPAGGGITEQWAEAPAYGVEVSVAATTTLTGNTAPATALNVEIHFGGA